MWFWPFWLIFPAVLLAFLVLRLVFWRRWGFGGCGGWGYAAMPADAAAIVDRRLATGEIDEATHARLKEALRK